MGLTPAFSSLTDGHTLPVRLSSEAYGLALGGAAIAFVAMLVPTAAASRTDPQRHRAGLARPPSASFFTRYYIDLFVAVIAGLLYWELSQRGALVTTSFAGERSVDRALLAAPALFLVAAGLLLLRLFPLAMRALGWAASNLRQAWLVLGLWQMGRDPVPYTRPILLLMLAASVAMFAANFGGTVNRSYEERARYRSGGDVLVQGAPMERRGASVSFRERYAALFEGQRASPAYRARAGQALQLFSSIDFDLLAVDPATFPDAAWYRGDFSSAPLEGLMTAISEEGEPAGLVLSADAERLGIWARSATPRRDVSLRARLRDANGRYTDFPLGAVSTGDWQYLETRIDSTNPQSPAGFRPKPPLRLVSLTIRQGGGQSLQPGAIYLDDLQMAGPSGAP
jgi:hypothetical protein